MSIPGHSLWEYSAKTAQYRHTGEHLRRMKVFLPPDTMTPIIFGRQRIGKVQTSKFEAKNLGDCWNFFQVTC